MNMTRRWMERLAAPSWWPIERKAKKFVVPPRGSHAMDNSMSLTVVVRDVLGLAATAKEARHVIKSAKVVVDGRPRKDVKFGVGPMDIIEIAGVGTWRAVPGRRISFVSTSGPDSKLKLCRITGKRNVRGRKLQFGLHDGRSLLSEQTWAVGDSILLEVPEQKVVGHFRFEPGAMVLLTKGSRAGVVAKLDSIERQLGRAWLMLGEERFEAPIAAMFVVGKEKPAVKLVG